MHPAPDHFPKVRAHTGQSRQAIILRVAALIAKQWCLRKSQAQDLRLFALGVTASASSSTAQKMRRPQRQSSADRVATMAVVSTLIETPSTPILLIAVAN
jgi:hypothetical protein